MKAQFLANVSLLAQKRGKKSKQNGVIINEHKAKMFSSQCIDTGIK